MKKVNLLRSASNPAKPVSAESGELLSLRDFFGRLQNLTSHTVSTSDDLAQLDDEITVAYFAVMNDGGDHSSAIAGLLSGIGDRLGVVRRKLSDARERTGLVAGVKAEGLADAAVAS